MPVVMVGMFFTSYGSNLAYKMVNIGFFEKLKSLEQIFKNPWVKNIKIQFLLHTIQRLIQEDDFAQMTYFPGHSEKCVMHIDKF